MLQDAGNVYNIAQENRPLPQSTITNVIYEGVNYRYTCYSMGKGTTFMPERHRFIGLVICDEGRLWVEAKDGDGLHRTPVEKDQVFLRPAYQLIGFRAETDCVFVEFDFPIGCEMMEDLFPEKPFSIFDLVQFDRKTGASRSMILGGGEFEFDVIAYCSGYERPENTWARGMVHVYKGVLQVERDGEKLVMNPGDNLVTRAKDKVAVKAETDVVFATFYRHADHVGVSSNQ